MGEHPHAALWPLLRTWTLAVSILPDDHLAYTAWREACLQLGLADQGLIERIAALDVYLDTVDETLDTWAQENGV